MIKILMSRRIAGFITEWDAWGRFRVTFPRIRDGIDTLNTEAQFSTMRCQGWSPVKECSYIARPDEKNNIKCFAYSHMGRRITDFSECVQHSAVFEVDFVPFNDSWWIRVASIRLMD